MNRRFGGAPLCPAPPMCSPRHRIGGGESQGAGPKCPTGNGNLRHYGCVVRWTIPPSHKAECLSTTARQFAKFVPAPFCSRFNLAIAVRFMLIQRPDQLVPTRHQPVNFPIVQRQFWTRRAARKTGEAIHVTGRRIPAAAATGKTRGTTTKGLVRNIFLAKVSQSLRHRVAG